MGRIVPPKASNPIPRLSISTNGQQNALAFLLREVTFFVLERTGKQLQGCALRKISGSPLGSQAFYLSRPGLKVGRPAKNFGEPFGLPSIPAGVPRPLKLVAWVHVMRKYFVRTRILLACWSPNSVILAFGFDQNPHVLL